METKLKSMFVAALTLAASTQKLGINLIRVAILVIFVWIGGLKFWNYEAEGIVPSSLIFAGKIIFKQFVACFNTFNDSFAVIKARF